MKKTILLLTLFLAGALSAAAQTVLYLPGTAAVIDAKARAQCQMTVNRIDNRMTKIPPLKCDTFSYVNLRICLDEQGKLRKYVREDRLESEFGITAAYYDEHGELVYIYVREGNNCNLSEESLYFNDGKLIDFSWEYTCDCCDGTSAVYAMTKGTLPVIGKTLLRTLGFRHLLKNFLQAGTLLAILKSDEYSDGLEYSDSAQ